VPDGLTFVRRHPDMFRALAHDGPAAAALLVETALRRSAGRIEVRRLDDWHVVSADLDWLADLGDRDPFAELIPFPALGPNAVHPEVIVAAFADALTTVSGGEVRRVTGDPPDLATMFPTGYPGGRAVAFRFGPGQPVGGALV
jgi:hypothetical protein